MSALEWEVLYADFESCCHFGAFDEGREEDRPAHRSAVPLLRVYWSVRRRGFGVHRAQWFLDPFDNLPKSSSVLM